MASYWPVHSQGGRSLSLCDGQILVDGIDDERFQVYAVLLAVCKVNESRLDVQWNGWIV